MRNHQDSLVAVPWDFQEASFSQSSGSIQRVFFPLDPNLWGVHLT